MGVNSIGGGDVPSRIKTVQQQFNVVNRLFCLPLLLAAMLHK